MKTGWNFFSVHGMHFLSAVSVTDVQSGAMNVRIMMSSRSQGFGQYNSRSS